MVGDTALGKIIGADAIGAVARADEVLAGRRLLVGLLLDLLRLDARREHAPRLLGVLVLAPAVLALPHAPRGQVGEANRRIGLVHVLAAGAARAIGIDANVRWVDLDIGRGDFGHHRHRRRRRVDAALRLGRRHALHAVAAGLELELRVGAMPDDARDDLLVASGLAQALRNDLDLPAVALGEARVHAEEVAREDRALVAAGSGADLEEEIALVVRIARHEHALQLRLEAREALAPRADLVLGESAGLRVLGHLLGG